MAVGFISSGTSTGTAATAAAGANGTPAMGEFLVAVFQTATATTIALQSGSSTWSQLGTTQDWASSGRSSAVFYKIASGSGDTSVGVNFGASVANQRIFSRYSGVDTSAPVNDYHFNIDSDTSSQTVPVSSLTTTATSRVVLIGHSAGQAMTVPANFISRTTSSTNGNTNWADIGPDYAAGTLGGWSFTGMASSVQHAAWSIALKEDPARREPAWEATVAGGGGSNSHVPGTPSAIQNGDLMLLGLEISTTTGTIDTVPSGWTLIKSTVSGQCTFKTYWKTYDGTIGSFGLSGVLQHRSINARFTSPHTTPVGTVAENSGLASGTVTFPALTPTTDGLLFYVGSSASAAAQTNSATTPTNATERLDSSSSSASGSTHVFGGTTGNVSAGVATSTFTSTLTNSADWAAQTIVLPSKPRSPDHQRWAPDAIVSMAGLTGAVGSIQDDPDSPDGSWLIT